ncbi:MAG: hypothetical protein HYW48_06585 [Deltaproteobacteria bacterium]|nr:hypothetical protein [Deltaproteobacteria bacterium]
MWHDHDEPGFKYRDSVVKALLSIARSIKIVSIPSEFPEKWDLADDPPAGWNTLELRKLLQNATPPDLQHQKKQEEEQLVAAVAQRQHRYCDRTGIQSCRNRH